MWPSVGFVLGLGLLLKGPIILIFFYLTVLFILHYEKKLKELLCLQHLSGIFVMLAIFGAWALTACAFKPQDTEPGRQTTMSGEWISDVLDCIVGMDKLNFASWGKNIIQAMLYFLPWLLFFPCLWNKKYMSEVPDEKKVLLKGMLMAIVTGFFLVSLMPGTRAAILFPFYQYPVSWSDCCCQASP
jgi:4-amino-4-deoxy-L-arabinose transferase-like glycosyltransferase